MPELTLANLIETSASHSPAKSSDAGRSGSRPGPIEHRGSDDHPRRRSNDHRQRDLSDKASDPRQGESAPSKAKGYLQAQQPASAEQTRKGADGKDLNVRPKFRQMVEEILAGASAGMQQAQPQALKAQPGQDSPRVGLVDGDLSGELSLEESVARFLSRRNAARPEQDAAGRAGKVQGLRGKVDGGTASDLQAASRHAKPSADTPNAVPQEATQPQTTETAAAKGEAIVETPIRPVAPTTDKPQIPQGKTIAPQAQKSAAEVANASADPAVESQARPAVATQKAPADQLAPASTPVRKVAAGQADQPIRTQKNQAGTESSTHHSNAQPSSTQEPQALRVAANADALQADATRPADRPADRAARQTRPARVAASKASRVSATKPAAVGPVETDKPSALGEFLARARKAQAQDQASQNHRAETPQARPATQQGPAARPAGEDRYDIASRLERQARTKMTSRNQAPQAGPAARPATMQAPQNAGEILAHPASAVEMANPAAPAGAAMPAQPMPPQPSPVTEQIFSEINLQQNLVNRELTVQLNPRELGQVRIVFRQDGQEMVGQIRVENNQTLAELQREMPALIERLGQQGMQVRNIELEMNNDPSQSRHDAPGQGQFGESQSMFGQSGQGRGERGEMTDGSREPAFASSAQVSDETDPAAGSGQYVSHSHLNVMI